MKQNKDCNNCFGTGFFISSVSGLTTKCPKCKGIGKTNTVDEILAKSHKLAQDLKKRSKEDNLKEFGEMLGVE